MSQIVVSWSGDGLVRVEAALKDIAGSSRKRTVLRRAINHTGDKVHTRVVRALARQIRAPQHVIKKYGAVRRIKANAQDLTYTIRSDGGPIPLKYFRANQTRKGVSAAPWGNRKVYRHAFLISKFANHAFWRAGPKRLPIERIAGPNVPKELVKDQARQVFEQVTSKELPERVAHELKVLAKGVLS